MVVLPYVTAVIIVSVGFRPIPVDITNRFAIGPVPLAVSACLAETNVGIGIINSASAYIKPLKNS